jgi:thioredoxin 1
LVIGAGVIFALAFLIPGCHFGTGTITELNESNFQSLVLDSKQPVLVDFSATWCGPCRSMEPVLEELAKEFKGKALIGRVDVDQNPSLAKQYGASSIPLFIVFQGGKEVDRQRGACAKSRLAGMLSGAR